MVIVTLCKGGQFRFDGRNRIVEHRAVRSHVRGFPFTTQPRQRELQALTTACRGTFGRRCLPSRAQTLALGLLVLHVLTLEAAGHAVF